MDSIVSQRTKVNEVAIKALAVAGIPSMLLRTRRSQYRSQRTHGSDARSVSDTLFGLIVMDRICARDAHRMVTVSLDR